MSMSGSCRGEEVSKTIVENSGSHDMTHRFHVPDVVSAPYSTAAATHRYRGAEAAGPWDQSRIKICRYKK